MIRALHVQGVLQDAGQLLYACHTCQGVRKHIVAPRCDVLRGRGVCARLAVLPYACYKASRVQADPRPATCTAVLNAARQLHNILPATANRGIHQACMLISAQVMHPGGSETGCHRHGPQDSPGRAYLQVRRCPVSALAGSAAASPLAPGWTGRDSAPTDTRGLQRPLKSKINNCRRPRISAF